MSEEAEIYLGIDEETIIAEAKREVEAMDDEEVRGRMVQARIMGKLLVMGREYRSGQVRKFLEDVKGRPGLEEYIRLVDKLLISEFETSMRAAGYTPDEIEGIKRQMVPLAGGLIN